ncbi:hypothetical protein [Flavobacterium sp. UBA7663]|uniref:hypothetical protein n=1 Tax=Flavobacterium sp. UBA7663 TaxID=1946557 RepID=UPI0025C69F03|nr:hypothetical protein [Flavobacterium sp. UBA7663]
MYSLNKKISDDGFKVLDTNSYYIETFEGIDSNESQRFNPMIYKFHSDGYFKEDSYLYFGNFDKVRSKNSIYYGGRYFIEGQKIFMESFYSFKGSKTNRYSKVISKGTIKNDTINIDFFGTNHKFVKKNIIRFSTNHYEKKPIFFAYSITCKLFNRR